MGHRPTILVVDDTPQNIRILEAVLAPRGYSVVSAASGAEALHKVAQERPVPTYSLLRLRAADLNQAELDPRR
jgi:CheY-like chemotaxis protein